jgi:hypothetical protein
MARKLSREEERLFHEALSAEQSEWPDKNPQGADATQPPRNESQRSPPRAMAAWLLQRGTKEKA